MIKSIKKSLIVSLSALLLGALSPSMPSAEVVDRIVAIINDSIITLSELNAATAMALEKLSLEERKDGRKIVEVKSTILDSLIEQKLIKQASDNAGIEISEREIDNAVDDIKKQNEMTQDSLLLALAQNGLTYREYREQLKEQIRQVKFINKEFRSKISIQQEEIEEYYRQNIDEFYGPAVYRVQMIFVPSDSPAVMKERIAVIDEGLKKKTDFGQLAREYSDGPEAANGGDLGYLKHGELDKPLEDLISGMKAGDVGSLKMTGGKYYIKLVDTKPPQPRPLSEVSFQIHDRLFKKIMDERFGFWLKEVKRFAHIEVRL